MSHPAPPSSVLGRLLEAAGYRLDERPEGLVAVRGRDHRAVAIVDTHQSPTTLDTVFPADSVHRTIVYDDDPGAVARALAADRGIEILDPSTLGSALGELLLPPPEHTVEDAAAFPRLDAPLPIAPEGRRIVLPRIGRAEAEALAGVDTSRFTLRLVPFYVAGYHVRPAAPHGRAGPVVRQLVAVNALNRRVEVWSEVDRELVDDLKEPHQEFRPQLPESGATALALEAIRRHHTVHVDHTEQHGGALVIETRRVPPSADDIRLGPFAVIWVPYWYAEGAEGRVVLDAVTGHRVSAGETVAP